MNGQNDIEITPELKKLTEAATKAANITSEVAYEYIIKATESEFKWLKLVSEMLAKRVPMDLDKIYQDFADNLGLEGLDDEQKMNALLTHVINEIP